MTDTTAVEVAARPFLTFEGRDFAVADRFGLMPLLRFAHHAKQGMDTADIESLSAIYDVLAQAIAEDEWEAFCDHATATRADADQLLAVVRQAIEVMSARPTVRPSDSSDGPPATETNSSDVSSSPAPSTLTPRQQQLREQYPHLRPVGEMASELMSGTG